MKKIAPIIFSIVVFLVAYLLWYFMLSESQTTSDVTGISILSDQKPVPDSTLITGVSTSNDEKITPTVQPTPKFEVPTFDNLNEVTAENLDLFTNRNLEEALSGDLGAGFRVGALIKRCFDVPKSNQLLEIKIKHQIEFMSALNQFGRDFPSYQSDDPQQLFPTNEENRIHQTRWFNACLAQSQIFNSIFRERLEYLANHGM